MFTTKAERHKALKTFMALCLYGYEVEICCSEWYKISVPSCLSCKPPQFEYYERNTPELRKDVHGGENHVEEHVVVNNAGIFASNRRFLGAQGTRSCAPKPK